MWRTCVSTVFGLRKSVLAMPSFEWPSAISASTSSSRWLSSSSGLALARAPYEPRDDRRVDDALAVGDALQRVDEHGDVGHALLEQVAGALGVLLEQAHRVVRLEVVGEHEHADVAGASARISLRGDEPLVGVGRRHPDVDDRDVGPA